MAMLDPVMNEYNKAATGRPGIGSIKIAGWTEAGFALSFESYAHWQRAESAAAVVGQLAGVSVNRATNGIGVDGDLLAAFVATQAAAHARESKGQESCFVVAEARSRAPLAADLVMAAAAPSPVLVMCGLWQVLQEKEFNLPLEIVKNKLIAKVEEDLARDILTANIAAFHKDMEAAKGKAAEADKVIAKYIKESGWEHGASDKFDDVYNMGQDPKLAPLKEAYIADHFDDPKAKFFAYQFFSGGAAAQPKLYTPTDMTNRAKETTFVFWHTADEPAKVLTCSNRPSQSGRKGSSSFPKKPAS